MTLKSPTIQRGDHEALRRLARVRASRDFYQHHLNEWMEKGLRFVVLYGDRVVSEGGEGTSGGSVLLAANSRAKHDGFDVSDCVLIQIPKKGETYFF